MKEIFRWILIAVLSPIIFVGAIFCLATAFGIWILDENTTFRAAWLSVIK